MKQDRELERASETKAVSQRNKRHYFLTVSQPLISEAQTTTPPPPHNAPYKAILNLLCVFVCVYFSAPLTDRAGQRDANSDVVSQHALCYWRGATYQLLRV